MKKVKISTDKAFQPQVAIVSGYTLIAVLYCIIFSYIFLAIVGNLFLSIVHLFAFFSVTFNYFILRKSKNFERATKIVLITGTIVVLCLFATGGWEKTGYLWPFAYLPFAFFLTRGRKGRFWVFLLFSGCVFLAFLNALNLFSLPYSLVELFNFFASFLIFSICIILYQEATINYETFITYERNLLESSLDPIISVDEELIITDANKITEKYTGLPHHQLIGSDFVKYFKEPDKAREMCIQSLAEHPVQNKQLTIKHVNGSETPVLFNAQSFENIAGTAKKIFAIARDITVQNRMEFELKESEERIRSIFNAAPDAVIVMNEAGKIVRWNPKAESVFGWSFEDAHDKILADLIIPERYREAHKKGLKKFLVTGKGPVLNKTIEMPALKRTGEEFFVELTISDTMVKGEYFFIGFLRDVSERKKFQEEIKKTRDFLDTVVENIPNMVFIKDAKELRYLRFNKAGEDMLGVRSEDVIGKTDFELLDKKRAEGITNSDREVLEQRKMIDLPEETIHIKDDQIKILHTKKVPILDSNGKPVYLLGISEDITELKHAYDNLKSRTEDLKRSNSELEQFAYISSHDLQEPLRMVASFLQLLQLKYKDKLDKEANEYIEFAVEGSRRMKDLISGLLEYSRIGRIEKHDELIDLNIVLNEVKSDLAVLIKDKNAIVQVDHLPMVLSNAMEMHQLFQNLISNSIKFNLKEIPRVKVSFQKVNEEIIFSVSDNGIGIDKAYFDKIFLIFQRLNPREQFPGTGIGLAICKKIIDKHQGKIWVESQLGSGSTFYFNLNPKRNNQMK